jgi:tetratricopeptide (TPR) repeat protein
MRLPRQMTKGDRLPSAGPGKIIPGPKPAAGAEESRSGTGQTSEAAQNGSALPRMPAESNNIIRPRSFAAPPPGAPDAAEALYYEGMAAYQHRNWELALDRFTRLKELQPARPGLAALLDEVRWFQQLQATAPDATGAAELPPHGKAAPGLRVFAPLKRWQTWGLILLALVGVTALVLFSAGGRLPWTTASEREAHELLDRGQARLLAGDYEGAQAAYKKLLETAPDSVDAQTGLARAQRQQTLAQGFAAAEAAIAEEDWDRAARELEKILAVDPNFSDAQAKSDFVAQRQRLAALYADGSRLYDLGQWEEAIGQFEKTRELDNSFRGEAVAEFLFVSYLNAGQALIDGAGDGPTAVTKAVEYFSRALAIHPRNRLAAEAHRKATLYLDALRTLGEGDLVGGQSRLEGLLREDPAYARGAVAQAYFSLLIRKAKDTLTAGDIPGALGLYRQAKAVPVSDPSAAEQGETLVLSITPTPTPLPTVTPPPTSVPPPVGIASDGPLGLRSGPGRLYPIIGEVPVGAQVIIVGRSTDKAWWRVCYAANGGSECTTPAGVTPKKGQQGWVPYAALDVRGRTDTVAVVTPSVSLPVAVRATATPSTTKVCVTGHIYNVAGGTPLRNWILQLTGPDGTARSTRSYYNGLYGFNDLAPGIYTLSIQGQSGWRIVSPPSSVIDVAPSKACVEVDFWNERNQDSDGSGAPSASPTPER